MKSFATYLRGYCGARRYPAGRAGRPGPDYYRQPSPQSTVMQRVGLTDVTITYSRPSAKDRAIFGADNAVVPNWQALAHRAPTPPPASSSRTT
ncbi:MAG: DUF2911 domain-containing protein [Hymenobacter sp.]